MSERVRARSRLRRTAGAIGKWLAWCVPLAIVGGAQALRPGPALTGMGLGLLLAVVMIARSGGRRRRWATIGLRRTGVRTSQLVGGAFLFVAYGVCAEVVMARIWSGPPAASPMRYPFSAAPLGWLVIVLATCLVAPLLEELTFRGQLQPRLARVWGPLPAVISAAAIFAVAHSPATMLPVFIGGILLGHARMATRSIWTPIALHFTHNAVSTATAFTVPDWSFGAEQLPTWALVPLTLLFAGACATIVGAGARAHGRARRTARALVPTMATEEPESRARVTAAGPVGSGSTG